MSSQVEQIKAKLGIAEVVGSYLKLEKSGGNFKACCPFHNEKTPSFYVSPARDTYHCFGCNRGGDIFSFVQEIEGLDFLGALEVLAARAGVELKPIDIKAKTENERLYAILEEATKFFHTNLLQGEEAKQYVKGRNLTEESVRKFRIGLAKPEWSSLYEHLLLKDFKDEDIEKAGLIIKTSQSIRHAGGKYYDRFRGRIMFPICDVSGRTVGFSGRIIVASEHEEAKYINTPQTALYDKSRVLFGYDKAKTEIRQKDCCVLVEGQMDLVSSHQAGVTNTVAVSGTALTAQHLGLIKRLTDNLIMSFDGDMAGINAARRGVILALNLDMEVTIALLPDGMDPADLVAQSKERWAEAIAGAKHIVDFCLEALGRQKLDKRTLSKKIVDEVLPFVAAIPNSIRQAEFISKIAYFLGSREESIWDELKKIELPMAGDDNEFTVSLPSASAKATPDRFSRRAAIERKLFGLWYGQTDETESSETGEKIKEVLGGSDFELSKIRYDALKDELLLEAELTYGEDNSPGKEILELVDNLKGEVLREELEMLLIKIRELEKNGKDDDLQKLLGRCREITQEINSLKKAL